MHICAAKKLYLMCTLDIVFLLHLDNMLLLLYEGTVNSYMYVVMCNVCTVPLM